MTQSILVNKLVFCLTYICVVLCFKQNSKTKTTNVFNYCNILTYGKYNKKHKVFICFQYNIKQTKMLKQYIIFNN